MEKILIVMLEACEFKSCEVHSKYENKIENTNQKAKAYTKTLRKDNE